MNEARSIERYPVDSKAFASIGYDSVRRVLSIAFNSGHIWHYRDVSPEAFDAFSYAPSRGSYFAKYVRGHFPAEQMTGICPTCAKNGVKNPIGLVGEQCVTCKTIIRPVEAHRKP